IGQLYFAASSDITIRNVTLDKDGIILAKTIDSKVTNTTTKTQGTVSGVALYYSDSNTITKNTFNTTTGWGAYAVYLYSGSDSNTISDNNINTAAEHSYGIFLKDSSKLNNITQNKIKTIARYAYGIYFYPGVDSNNASGNTIITSADYARGIYLFYADMNTFSNNTIRTAGMNAHGTNLEISVKNTFINNSIETSGDGGSGSNGIFLDRSNTNTFTGNNITALGDTNKGVYILSSSSDTILGGSIISRFSYDYYLLGAGSTNNFTSTNFTEPRKIRFSDTNSRFNYRDDPLSDLRLTTRVSTPSTLERTITTWSTSILKWNETSSANQAVTYTITGLTPFALYLVYKDGASPPLFTLNADVDGVLPAFSINLAPATETEITVTGYVPPPSITLHHPDQNGTYYTTVPYFNGTCTSSIGISDIWTNLTEYSDHDTTSPFNFANTDPLTATRNDVNITCNDTLGSQSSATFWFYYDATPPIVNITNTPDPVVSEGTEVFEVTCDDGTGMGCNITTIYVGQETCTVNHTTAIPETNCSITFATFCELNLYTYTSDSIDLFSNHNTSQTGTFDIKKKDGCNCVSADECLSNSCLGYFLCAPAIPPKVSFVLSGPSSFELILGEEKELVLNIENKLDMPDTVRIKLSGSPENIEGWLELDESISIDENDQKPTRMINLDSKSSVSIPIGIHAGKIGSYKLTVNAKSMTTGMDVYNTTQFSVVHVSKESITSNTPGLSWLGIIVALFLVALIYKKRKKSSGPYIL
ncbi:MAG: NosD domain-containing protein, partial [archaeon]